MSRDEVIDAVIKGFSDAGRKDDMLIVGVAALAGVPEKKIERYMDPKLNSAQLIEMLASLIDGIGEQSLETFVKGNTSAEDMRTYRLASRGDRLMDAMAEQIVQVRELVEKLSGPDKVTKMMREMKTDITSVKGCVESIEEKIGKGESPLKKEEKKVSASSVKENKEAKEEAVKQMETVTTDPKAAQNNRLAGYMNRMMYPSENDVKAAAGGTQRAMDYVTSEGVQISVEPKEESDRRGLFGLFRRINEDKVKVNKDATDKRKTMKALNSIVDLDLDHEKLEAISYGAGVGITADVLERFARKGKNASQIYHYIDIFRAMYIGGAGEATA